MRSITKLLDTPEHKADALNTLQNFQVEPGAYMMIVVPPTLYVAYVEPPTQPKDYAENDEKAAA